MKIVVIGAVAAGTSVIAKARRNSEEVEIVCYTAGRDISYSGCGIPYYVGEDYISRKNLTPRDVKWFKDRFNVDIFTAHKVEKIISEEKKIVVKNEITGEDFIDSYDKLVITSGARARELEYKDENIFYVRNVEDGDRIKDFINKNNPKSALVIGGGFIGLEMLENLTSRGIKTTLIEQEDRIGGKLDKDISRMLEKYLKKQGIEVILKDSVEIVEKNRVKTINGKDIEAELIIGAIGVIPNTEFLQGIGIELSREGAIKVNKYLETNIKDIYAAGDCALAYSSITGEEIYLPLGSTANKMGRILGDRLTGGNLEFKGVLGTSIFRVFNLVVGKTGLSQEEAEARGYDIEIIHNIKPNQTEYLESSREMMIKAIADRKTGKLLGVQIVGENGVDKRLDVFATLLTFGATVDQLFHIDLAYAPPFSTTKDPVAYTGMILDNAINGRNKIITPEELKANFSKYLIIDTRSESQYNSAHIEGARNIPLEKLREKLNELPRDKKIVVHCNKGTTGNAAQNILLNYGFDVYNLSGGFKNYNN